MDINSIIYQIILNLNIVKYIILKIKIIEADDWIRKYFIKISEFHLILFLLIIIGINEIKFNSNITQII